MGDGGREVATGTVAGYGGRARGRAEPGCPGVEPPRDGEPVLEGLRGTGAPGRAGTPAPRSGSRWPGPARAKAHRSPRRLITKPPPCRNRTGCSRPGPGRYTRTDSGPAGPMTSTSSTLCSAPGVLCRASTPRSILSHSLRGQLADGHVRADRPAGKKLADIRINLDHALQSKRLLSAHQSAQLSRRRPARAAQPGRRSPRVECGCRPMPGPGLIVRSELSSSPRSGRGCAAIRRKPMDHETVVAYLDRVASS